MYRSRLPQIAAELDGVTAAAVRAGAELVAQSARDRVPVDTGHLRDAIHTETDVEGSYVVAGDDRVFYGHLVEHGGAHTPPRPFLVPALEERRADVTALAVAAVRRIT